MTNEYLQTKKNEAAQIVEGLISMLINDFSMDRNSAIEAVKKSTLKDYNRLRGECNSIPSTSTYQPHLVIFEARDTARLIKECAEGL